MLNFVFSRQYLYLQYKNIIHTINNFHSSLCSSKYNFSAYPNPFKYNSFPIREYFCFVLETVGNDTLTHNHLHSKNNIHTKIMTAKNNHHSKTKLKRKKHIGLPKNDDLTCKFCVKVPFSCAHST